MSTLYEIAEPEFDALAAGRGGPGAVRTLRQSRVTKQLVMARALRQLAADVAPAAVPDLDVADRVIERARGLDTRAADRVLGHPAVGSWLSACLRRLVGVEDGPHPVDVEVRQFCAVAATAGIRAGLDFELAVPRRFGGVFLPGLGLARIPGADAAGPATVWHAAGGTRVEADGRAVVLPADPTSDAEGWQGVRRLRSEVSGLAVEVEVDDLDPVRDGHGEAIAPRQTAEQLAGWQALFDAGWQVLVRDHRERAEELAEGLAAVIPLVGDDGCSMAVTARDAFGSLCATLGTNGVSFADTLIHEFQHSKLYALCDIVPLHAPNRDPAHYSPWREDPRPLGGLLHGAYSYVGVTDYWDGQRHQGKSEAGLAYAEFEFHRWSRQVAATVEVLLASGELTSAGVRFVRGMGAATEPWQADFGTPRLRRLADMAIADHRIRWRLRNRRPAEEAIRVLADAYREGDELPVNPAEVAATVPPGSRRQPMSDRLRLTQFWLQQPERFDEVCADPDRLGGGTLIAPDIDLLRGDHEAAYQGYLDRIVAGSQELEVWAGLVLSRHGAEFRAPVAPVWSVPEVLFALTRELRSRGVAPDVGALAGWLSPAYESAWAAAGRTR